MKKRAKNAELICLTPVAFLLAVRRCIMFIDAWRRGLAAEWAWPSEPRRRTANPQRRFPLGNKETVKQRPSSRHRSIEKRFLRVFSCNKFHGPRRRDLIQAQVQSSVGPR